uniref:Solute carrier family 25 member 47 n=1 Tax=Calidris pygmaea TaxID=425635 RepID=A0A8C3PLW7_9CHAR
MDFIAGAIGGGLSTAVGYPLDTVKVRIQTERHYNGIWHCIQETYRTEKVWGFYKGMSASVLSVSVISSVSFGTYRNFLCTICKLRYGAADAKPSKLDISLAGGGAGAARVGKKPRGKAQRRELVHKHRRLEMQGMFSLGGARNKPAGFVFPGAGGHTPTAPSPR